MCIILISELEPADSAWFHHEWRVRSFNYKGKRSHRWRFKSMLVVHACLLRLERATFLKLLQMLCL